METLLIIVLFAVGLALIIKGGDVFVDTASWIAESFGIPKFIIGATIVSLATTIPELLVSILATLEGSTGLAIGNAVGSVTGNLGLIMGISIVCMPSMLKRSEYAPKGLLMILSCAMLWMFSSSGELSIAGSLVMLAVFALFVVMNLRDARKSMLEDAASIPATRDREGLGKKLLMFVVAAAAIALGAQLLVDNGSEIARLLGVPDSIIGVTLVAIGTSLPELVTTLTAIRKKNAALSIGNIIGANIIDLTVILPICSLISGGKLALLPQSLQLDLPVCLAFCALAIVPTLWTGKFRKTQGAAMLLCYAAYIVMLVLPA